MQFDFYFIAKSILLFYILGLIAFCVLFVLKSRKFYFNLKSFEKLCVYRKRDIVHNFLPMVLYLAKKNEFFKTVFNLDKHNLKDFFLSVFPLFFYQWIKTSFNLTKKVLR